MGLAVLVASLFEGEKHSAHTADPRRVPVSDASHPPSNRPATGTARAKERSSEHKVEDESNQIGYEGSGNHPGPSRHLTPFCVPIDISEGKEKSRGEDATR